MLYAGRTQVSWHQERVSNPETRVTDNCETLLEPVLGIELMPSARVMNALHQCTISTTVL